MAFLLRCLRDSRTKSGDLDLLPPAEQEGAYGQPLPRLQQLEEPSDASSRSFRVLVADDDLAGLLLAESVLAMLGVEVVSAKDGRECIDAFRVQRFDIVFMDHLMPNMTGLEATIEIRRIEGELGRLRTPIVALTASAYPSDMDAFFGIGADDILLKPYRIEQLAEMLQKWAPCR